MDKQGNILHMDIFPACVSNLIYELLDWAENSDVHMLIKSCVFHYEFELKYHFADSNGRIGGWWHILLLTEWKPMFTWLPITTIIHERQDE